MGGLRAKTVLRAKTSLRVILVDQKKTQITRNSAKTLYSYKYLFKCTNYQNFLAPDHPLGHRSSAESSYLLLEYGSQCGLKSGESQLANRHPVVGELREVEENTGGFHHRAEASTSPTLLLHWHCLVLYWTVMEFY